MPFYIAQQRMDGRTTLWEAEDENDIIRLCEQKFECEFETADQAVSHDQQRSMIETCPAHLIAPTRNVWPGLIDSVWEKWGHDPEAEVDLQDEEEWGFDTVGGQRLNRFQAEEISDLDGAEIGRAGDFDVIWIPEVGRAARVGNADAEWFNAHSFKDASLIAQGDWDGETRKG